MSVMNRQFSSTNIAAGSYNDVTQELTITFVDGGVYKYFDVPYDVWLGLEQASSVGSYFHANIKSGFAYERIG